MHPEKGPVQHTAEQMQKHLGDAPATAIVLGSGLGLVAERVEVRARVSTADLGLPRSTVKGHAGELLVGELAGASVAVLSGRVHLYEGITPGEVVRYVRALHEWGVKRLLLTCSAGAVNTDFQPGDLVLITDHLNFQGTSPLLGPVFGGTRFPDMSNAYSQTLRAALKSAAKETGLPLGEGVYAAMMGPAYETPAEIRMVRVCGGDLVGMSTAPEILAAAELGFEAAAIGFVSNMAAGLGDGALSHQEVMDLANERGKDLAELLEHVLPQLG